MSNQYSPDAQKSIDQAENKLGDAIKNLKTQTKSDEPVVEVVKEPIKEVEVVIDAPKEPRRSEFVKTDDPQVLARINDLYGQVKQSDKRNQMILEHNKLMEEKLAEYQDKLNKFEQATKNSAVDKVESELKAQLRTAREENDFDAIDSIEDKLLDLRVEKRLTDRVPPQQEKVVPKQQPLPQFDQQLIHNAAYIENLAQEKDTQGNLVRPYLYDWHPDNKKVVELFESIPKEFAAAGKQADIKTIMLALDERVRGKKTNAPSAVLGTDDNDPPQRTVIKLTQEEINVAKNMGITPERYARQKQLMS